MSITRKKRTPIQPAILTEEDKKRFNKDLLTLAVPLALQNLLGALVGASDALMLGRLNQASIAAVSLANQISFVMSLFTGSVIVPKAPSAKNENVLLRVYAHKDNTDRMVNGFTKNIMMLPYDENAAISDNQAPVISSMFINDEMNFTEGSVVNSSAMLYITATDDMGISVQANTVDNTMTLLLDGGKQSYSDITAYTTTHDGGKQITINFPLENMAEGLHTLTYTVYDMVGNSDTKTITFMVGQYGQVDLVADKLPALLDGEVNFDLDTDLARTPEVIVRVTDATGKLMWMTTSHNFPVTWDMKDMNGNKVPAGLYRYFGTYNDGANYGGTPINKLIVLDPVKTAGE